MLLGNQAGDSPDSVTSRDMSPPKTWHDEDTAATLIGKALAVRSAPGSVGAAVSPPATGGQG